MTLAVALTGLLLSLVSLGWQIWSWYSSGPRVRVSTSNAYPVFGHQIGDHYVVVTATNRGRSAVTLTSWVSACRIARAWSLWNRLRGPQTYPTALSLSPRQTFTCWQTKYAARLRKELSPTRTCDRSCD